MKRRNFIQSLTPLLMVGTPLLKVFGNDDKKDKIIYLKSEFIFKNESFNNYCYVEIKLDKDNSFVTPLSYNIDIEKDTYAIQNLEDFDDRCTCFVMSFYNNFIWNEKEQTRTQSPLRAVFALDKVDLNLNPHITIDSW